MNSKLGRDMDRAVERARDKALNELHSCPSCPECGNDLSNDWDDVWICVDCDISVEFYGPEEDAPKGGYTIHHKEDADEESTTDS